MSWCKSAAVLAVLLCAGRALPAESVIERYGLEESATPVRDRADWRKPKRILIGGLPGDLVRELATVAPDVEFLSANQRLSMDQLRTLDAAIGFCSAELLAAAPDLRWIQVLNNGVEGCVAIPSVRSRNILLTNMQRIGGPVIAEHVIAMTLALTRGLDVYIRHQASGTWEYAEGRRVSVVAGKTMLVVGLGGIGSEVAKRAHALGMRVVATRASRQAKPDYVSYVGTPAELVKLAGDADYVVNTVPLTRETTDLFDAAFFAKVKPGAYFINVARGGSVVTDALLGALTSGRLAGAGLDVMNPEPLPPDHPLWKQPNVIITPHVSGDSDLGSDGQREVVKENVRRYVAGDRMLSVVDLAKGY